MLVFLSLQADLCPLVSQVITGDKIKDLRVNVQAFMLRR